MAFKLRYMLHMLKMKKHFLFLSFILVTSNTFALQLSDKEKIFYKEFCLSNQVEHKILSPSEKHSIVDQQFGSTPENDALIFCQNINSLNTLSKNITTTAKYSTINAGLLEIKIVNGMTQELTITEEPKFNLLNCYLFRINVLPDSIVNLTSLKKMKIYGTGIRQLPNLKKAVTLDVNRIQNGIHYSLNYLQIESSYIDRLPTWIGDLTNLKTLTLRNTKIDTLPIEITKLHNLEHLNILNVDEWIENGRWVFEEAPKTLTIKKEIDEFFEKQQDDHKLSIIGSYNVDCSSQVYIPGLNVSK